MKYGLLFSLLPTLLGLCALAAFFGAVACYERQWTKRGTTLLVLGTFCVLVLALFHYIVDVVTYSAFLSFG